MPPQNSRHQNMNENLTLTLTTKPKYKRYSPPTQTLACAACKYQRRKCTKDCSFAPYFPSGNNSEDFINVHKLFGGSNFSKLFKKVEFESRDEFVTSVIYEANARKADPGEGCYGIIVNLMKQIAFCEAELEKVMHQINAIRAIAVGQSDFDSEGRNGLGMKIEELRF